MDFEEIKQTISDYWLKWLLGMCAALLAIFYKKIKKKIIEYAEFLKNKKKKNFLQDTNQKIEDLKISTNEKIEALQKNTNDKIEAFQKIVETFHEELMTGFKALDILTDKVEALREGILSSHFNALRDKAVFFIKQKWISAEDLELFEEDYLVYTDLGGNGKFNPWLIKVRSLPNDPKQIPMYE